MQTTAYGAQIHSPSSFATFRKALRDSVPVLFGYFPTGIVIGILFTQIGLEWYMPFLSSLIVYAGSAQFLSVSLMKSGTGLTEIFVTTFLLNIRHVFYGFSFLNRYRGLSAKPFLAFGLTDETYSILTSKGREVDDKRYCLYLTFINYSYWALGALLGGVLGSKISIQFKGIEFVMTALFTVLTVEQTLAKKKSFPLLIGIGASLLALSLGSQFLLLAISFATLALLVRSAKGAPRD